MKKKKTTTNLLMKSIVRLKQSIFILKWGVLFSNIWFWFMVERSEATLFIEMILTRVQCHIEENKSLISTNYAFCVFSSSSVVVTTVLKLWLNISKCNVNHSQDNYLSQIIYW